MAYFSGWQITRASIVFVLGVLVLGGLVFGGVWVVKERGEQARQKEAIAIAEQNLRQQSEETPTTAPAADSSQESPTDTSSEVAVESSAPQTATVLPQTGAEPTQIIALSVLTLSIAYYIGSRRALRDV